MEKASINLLSLTQWRVNHQKLLSEDRPKFLTNDDENNYSDVRLSVNYKISVNEIKKRHEKYEKWTANRSWWIFYRTDYGSEQLLESMTYVFNCFLRGHDHPPELKDACISNLHKKEKEKSSPTIGIYLSVTNSLSRLGIR